MSETDLNRLKWRCRRGLLELDLLLSEFLERRYETLSGPQQRAFERLLTHSDNDLWAWMTRPEVAADREIRALVESIRK